MPAQLNLSTGLRPETLTEGFTQSELSLLDECAFKWNLRYNNLLRRADDFSWTLFIGSTWHKFQELWRKTKGEYDLSKATFPIVPKGTNMDSEWEKRMEYWTAVIPAYQLAYAKMYREEAKHEWFVIEEEISAEFLGYRLRGKIDVASEAPRFIRDFKSTASAWLTSPNGWHFKLQFMLYCWLMAQAHKDWRNKQFNFQLDMMQKPGLKQTKEDGTWQGHIRRVVGDVAKRPEFYLTRQQSLVTPDALKHFEAHVLTPKIQRIALVVENPEVADAIINNPNTNSCNMFGHQCEFFEICEKGWDAGKFLFEQRPAKHEELESEAE